MSGEFILYVPESPRGLRIDSIVPYSQGLIFGCAGGVIKFFEGTESEHQIYLPREPEPDYLSGNRPAIKDFQLEPASIGQMLITVDEDLLYYIDRNNQLLMTRLSFDGSDPEAGSTFYVQGPFHNEKITGMDICLRK